MIDRAAQDMIAAGLRRLYPVPIEQDTPAALQALIAQLTLKPLHSVPSEPVAAQDTSPVPASLGA
jgi:hypothetical protein